MPNWCVSEIYICGDKKETQTLIKKIQEYTSHNAKENDFGLQWLGNIVLNSGFKTTDEDSVNGFECRGSILEYGIVNSVGLRILTQTAYEQMNKIWLTLIEKYAPHCKLHFIAEEPNHGVYEKYEDPSDSTAFFDDIDYKLEFELNDLDLDEKEINLFQSLTEKTGWSTAELLQKIRSFLGKNMTEEEMENFFKGYDSIIFEKFRMLNKEDV